MSVVAKRHVARQSGTPSPLLIDPFTTSSQRHHILLSNFATEALERLRDGVMDVPTRLIRGLLISP